MTTPNTAANGGKILTWQERYAAQFTKSVPTILPEIRFAEAEIADLRTALAAVPASEPQVTISESHLRTAIQEFRDLQKEIRSAGRPPHTDYWHQSIYEAEAKIDLALAASPASAPVSGMPDLAGLTRYVQDLDDKILPTDQARENPSSAEYFAAADVESLFPVPQASDSPVAPVTWLTRCIDSGLYEEADPNEKASNPKHWTDAFPVFAHPATPLPRQAAVRGEQDDPKWSKGYLSGQLISDSMGHKIRLHFDTRADAEAAFDAFISMSEARPVSAPEIKERL